MMENLLQSQMNDSFNQDMFKVIDKIRNEHKQQANVESIFEQIIKTTGNESISKSFLEDRIETLVTDDILENKPRQEKNSDYLTEKSKQLLLNVDGDMTEPLIQSQDTPTKHFTTSETGNFGNEFLAFKKYIMEELNDMKNRLEVPNNLGNASYSHEPTEKENLVLRNKNERNIKCNVDVNNNKRNFPSDEIFMPYNKTFELSQNIRNNKETNNINIKNFFQALATAADIKGTLNEISNTTIHQTVNEKATVNTITGQSE